MDASETQPLDLAALSDSAHPGHPLDLCADAFWHAPEAAMAAYMVAAMGRGQRGTVLDAPDVVELPARETLPLVGCHIAPDAEVSQWRFVEEAVLVAVAPVSGRCRVATVFAPPDEPLPPLPLPQGEASDGAIGSTFALDLFERPGLPREADDWIVTVIARDQASNRVHLSVADDATVWRDPEALRFIAARRVAEGPPPPSPPPAPAGQALPSYRHEPVSPPLEAGQGLALTVPRVVPLEPRARCVLAGCFRLPLQPHQRVAAARKVPGGPSAVLPVTLVWTASDAPGAQSVTLQVPVYDLPPEAAEAVGYFALDLLALPALRVRPRTCFVYAFAGEAMAGPAAVAFVDPAALALPR